MFCEAGDRVYKQENSPREIVWLATQNVDEPLYCALEATGAFLLSDEC